MTYELKDRKLPVLSGVPLEAFSRLLEVPGLRVPIINKLLEDAGIMHAREVKLQEAPTPQPAWPKGNSSGAPLTGDELARLPSEQPRPMVLPRIRDFAERYQSGSLSPETVAERVLQGHEAMERGAHPLRGMVAIDAANVREQARQSALRWKRGEQKSILDGVPVAVKDEVDCLPYATTGGTTFLGKEPAKADATVVARLREKGALLIGKANMHEIGINPTGFNRRFGQARNPHDPAHDPGGSSSGSAVVVAAGLAPVAIGADGGGSVRLPAGLCGLVGLKPTWGRLSEHGAVPLCWSVGHLGPLATSAEDAALAYAAMSGSDPLDPQSLNQPPASLEGAFSRDMIGVRVGIYREWFEHADDSLVKAAYAIVDAYKAAGAKVVEIDVPGLELERIAHSITIISEMAASMRSFAESPKAHAANVRLTLTVANALSSPDYVWAQRVRTQRMALWREIFTKVDLVVTPAMGTVSPKLVDPMPPQGWSDLATTMRLMRYITPGNLCGLPAIAFPSGYDANGLPLSVQAMARPWEEHLLLRAANVAEQSVERRRPRVFVELV
jgi:Asp-tRNA(Asn)/Glu-tRNA(Gln) amidotransferase A subunit family amidase